MADRRRTSIDGLGIDARPWVPAAEMEAAIAEAELVISHAGTGCALTTLNAGRLPILVARDPARGEIEDGHQFLLARELESSGLVLHRDAGEITLDDLREAVSHRVESL